MPRKPLPTKLVCPDGHYEVDAHAEGVKVPGKIPECPQCKKSLSFENAGALVAIDNSEVIWWTGFLILIPIVIAIFFHFREYDHRKVNSYQPVMEGQVLYGGKVRVPVPVPGESFIKYLRGRLFRPIAQDAKTKIKMVTRDQEYIFERREGPSVFLHYIEAEEGAVKEARNFKLVLKRGSAELDIPAVKDMKHGRAKKLRVTLPEDGEGLNAREV